MADNTENNKLTRVPVDLITPETSMAHMQLIGMGKLPPPNSLGKDGDFYIQLDEDEDTGN